MEILAVVGDLLLSSKITGELEPAGHAVKVLPNPSAALVHAHSQKPGAAIVDLGLDHGDPIELIRILKNELGLPVLAFGSHVDQESFEKAASVGCDKVVARSQFFGNINELVESIGTN
jgi:DNA-binding response OmpR family regulator